MSKYVNPNMHNVEINLGNPTRRNITVASVTSTPAPGVIRIIEMDTLKAAQFVQIGMLRQIADEAVTNVDLDVKEIEALASREVSSQFPGRRGGNEAAVEAEKARRANTEREFREKEAREMGKNNVQLQLSEAAEAQAAKQRDLDKGIIAGPTETAPSFTPGPDVAPTPAGNVTLPFLASVPLTQVEIKALMEKDPAAATTAPETVPAPAAPQQPVAIIGKASIEELRASAAAVAGGGDVHTAPGPSDAEIAAAEKEAIEASEIAARDMARMGISNVVDKNTKIDDEQEDA